METADTEGACRVCGGVFSPPLVTCSGCQTPHHEDCWSYNGGCAVYGCGVGDHQVPVAAEPVHLVEVLPDLAEEAQRVVMQTLVGGMVLGALLQALLPAAPALVFTLVAMWTHARKQLGLLHLEEQRRLVEGTEVRDTLELETKAVLAWVGRDAPDELAQAYALFEQRHPRTRLPGDAQAALGLELAGAGYRVLAAESLEKCFPHSLEDAPAEVLDAFRGLFADDPAFLDLAVADPAALRLDPRGLAGADCRYLVSLSRGGFPVDWRRSYLLPTEPPDAVAARTRWVAGPHGSDELWERMQTLVRAGEGVVPVTPAELELPARVHAVTRLALTSKEARFEVAGGEEFAFPWAEVRAIVFERIARVEERRVLTSTDKVGHRGSRSTTYGHSVRKETRHDSILEVHAGDPLRRLRVAGPSGELFAYLGRRMEHAYETNLRFAAKDLVRFAPHARASHGVLGMFSERPAGEGALASPRELEDRILAFHALGAPRVRAWWAGGGGGAKPDP